jgi:hypothetical protein
VSSSLDSGPADRCRYKPSLALRFITEELAFDSDSDTATFICEYISPEIFEEKEGAVRFMTSKAGTVFDDAKKAAFS